MKSFFARVLLKAGLLLPECIRKAIKSILPDLHKFMITHAFSGTSWLEEQTSRAKLSVNFKNYDSEKVSGPPSLRSFIFFSPWSPTLTGIANYASDLLEAARGSGEVYLAKSYFEPKDKIIEEFVFPFFSVESFRRPNTITIFHLGNGKHHWSTFREILNTPGFVIAHDPKIPDIPVFIEEDQSWWNFDYHEKSLRYYGRLPSHTKGIFVHSKTAERIILDQLEKANKKIPVHVLQTGHPIEIKPWTRSRKEFLIGTFGIQNETKNPLFTYHVMSFLCSTNQERAVICGPISKSIERKCRKIWHSYGNPPGNLKVTGKVSDSDFNAYLDSVNFGIQLRNNSNGESSGPVSKLLGRQVVCMVSDLGSFGEYPDDVVFKIQNQSAFNDISENPRIVEFSQLIGDRVKMEQYRNDILEYTRRRSFNQAWEEMQEQF